MQKHLFKVNPAKPNQRHNFIITDFVSNYEDIEELPQENFDDKSKKGCCQRICTNGMVLNPSFWLFLVLLGLFTALLAFFVDYSSQQLRKVIAELCFERTGYALGYVLWVAFSIGFTMIAASVGHFISRDAEGSGIPELKSILAGVNIYKYLSFQTLIGKTIGLFCGLMAGIDSLKNLGLSIGKEGPFVHLAAGVANKLAKIKIFKKIDSNQAVKKQMLAAAVAAGVASTFGAPMGGVLFSIEVTATYYMVSNLWKAFFCATWSVVAFKLVQGLQRAQLFTETTINNVEFGWHMFGYVVLGLFCGALGALFITVVGKIIYLRKKIQIAVISSRWGYCLVVAFVTALCSYPILFLQGTDRKNLQELFSPKSLTEINQKKWSDPAEGFNLFTFSFLKFVLTVLAVTCPIPAGVFTPIFTLGASFGRLFGFIVWMMFDKGFSHDYVPMYAIIGAAGVASSVTHTISVCVIVFELTGQVTFLMPLLLCVLVSYALGSSLSISYFDLLLDMKGLPYMPALRSKEAYNMDASDIMNKNFLYLTRKSTLSDIGILLQYVGNQPKTIPVVETSEQKLLLFSVQAQSLRKYLFQEYNKISHKLDLEVRSALNKYFYNITAISSQNQRQNWLNIDPELSASVHRNRRNRFIQGLNRDLEGNQAHELEEELAPSPPLTPAMQLGVELDERSLEISVMHTHSYELLEEFWNNEIDYSCLLIELDRAPFSVFEQTPLAKIHFLFTMLNLTQLFVLHKGVAVGIISKGEFLKNKTLQSGPRSHNI